MSRHRVALTSTDGDANPHLARRTWTCCQDGKEYAKYDSVVEFIPLQGVGHCPMDENPALVNPKIVDFVTRTAAAANS
jgi:pimeloyl-ACP methyl ester carboxylesterase